jgi:DNA-binding MarR family transcriptional regulator
MAGGNREDVRGSGHRWPSISCHDWLAGAPGAAKYSIWKISIQKYFDSKSCFNYSGGMTSARPRDLVTDSGLLFEAAAYTHRGISDDVERATGLPGAWLEVLLRLNRTPGGAVRVSDMASQVSFAPSSFSRLADRMEERGLLKRTADPANRRATLLRITDAGHEVLAEAEKVHDQSLQRRFAGLLTTGELDLLEIIARKLRDANMPR